MLNSFIIPEIAAQHAFIQTIRHDIHAHPELSYEEFRTSDAIANALISFGLEPIRNIGGTGIVAQIKRGSSTKSIGLRADMDALPIQEANQFAHCSKHAGKMHACGHDGHVAMLLAAAQYLTQHGQFNGTVNLIFQPAEEGGAGAKRMIEDGLFTRFPCDAVYAMHNWPGLPTGHFALRSGPMMASSNEFTITLTGKGCHAAMPHQGVDPAIIAAQVILALQSIVSRNIHPVESAVISVTQMNIGHASNVIEDQVVLKGTARTFNLDTLDLIEARMRQVIAHTAQAFGGVGELQFQRNYPPTINTPHETNLAEYVLQKFLSTTHIHTEILPSMGAEDFAYMLQTVPGSYIWIGNGEGEHRHLGHGLGPCMLHNPSYDFNDELIPIGASFWARLVSHYLTNT